MADVEKNVDLKDSSMGEGGTILDESPSAAAKKMRQGRLPFKPIGPKSQMSLTPHGLPKKRKLSDQESPSAKAAKVISKHQPERLKLDVSDKMQTESMEHENEVSSSSEAENIPLAMQKRKALESNILERFVRKSSQEEISSTNEVVDLTEISSSPVKSRKCDDVKSSLTEKAGDKLDSDSVILVDGDSSDSTSNKDVPKGGNIASNLCKETIEKPNAVKNDKCKDKATKVESGKEKKKSETSNDIKTNKETFEKPIINEVKNDKCKDKATKVESGKEKKKSETSNDAKTNMDKEKSVDDLDKQKETECVENTNNSNDNEKQANDVKEKSNNSEEKLKDIESENNECDLKSDKSAVLNSSTSSSGKSSSDVEDDSVSMDSDNDNSMADISSQGNSSNTSACKTPREKGNVPSVTKTPGGSSVQTSTPKSTRGRPKSLKMSEIKNDEKKKEREAMRQRIREQKERDRQEKKEKKEQERLEVQKKRNEEKAEKEKKKQEEKDKKERERREKKEQVEREKMEKQQQKDEEKKKKQELIDAKIEEKKKKEEERKHKEEEKRMKEEEKLKEEEEKNKKKMKEKQTFTKFFIKKEGQQPSKTKETSQFFMPFEIKKDMFLAPPYRRQLEDSTKCDMDTSIQSQDSGCLYLEDIKKSSYQKGKSLGTLPRKVMTVAEADPDADADDEVECLSDNEDDNAKTDTDKKKTLVEYRCKLLQFHTNYRPPYYGTWRKHSQSVSGRKPFGQDMDVFDYEVDSDDEWEEEEPGESVSSDEEEGEDKEEEVEEDEEEDGWMVPHGYLSEDEGCDQDEEITPEVLKARQMAKQEAWEAEQKKQKQPIRALVIGCIWEGQEIADKLAAKLAEFQAVCLSAVPIDTRCTSGDGAASGKDGEKGAGGKGNRRPVPEDAMPDLIRLIHGNTIGIKKLIKEFRLYWKKKTSKTLGETEGDNMEVEEAAPDESISEDKAKDDVEAGSTEGEKSEDADGCGISKRQLEIKIMSIAVREKRADFKKVCWYVHEKVLKQYELGELSLPNAWQYVSKGLVRVKNEEACGRRTPSNLSESFSDSVPIIMKEEEEAKTVPKDQPSIMQFAKKMQPSELPKPKLRRIELKPAGPKPVGPKPVAETKTDLNVSDLDTSATEEQLGPYKVLPKDQRSIMDFAKKPKPQHVQTIVVKPEIHPVPAGISLKETVPKIMEVKTSAIVNNKEDAMETDECIVLD